jgi:cytolysin (calcineurin-like family phosphatase)
VSIWASVGRDLAVAGAGGAARMREMELIDELPAIAPKVSAASLHAFLTQIGEIDRQLEENVTPELALDVLALSWPHVESGAVAGPGSAAPAAQTPARR